jgi:methylglyoxal synthase
MSHDPVAIESQKRIALVAHDNKKEDLLEWARYNRNLLASHQLFATGTTGTLLEEALRTPVVKLQSGPLGGDQQIFAVCRILECASPRAREFNSRRLPPYFERVACGE